jgi:GTPase
VAHPDTAAQRRDVLKVLGDMAEGPHAAMDEGWEARVAEVLNKADLLGGTGQVVGGDPGAVVVSALTGEGLPELRAAIDARVSAGMELVDYAIPAADGARLAWLYRHGEVVNREEREEGDIAVTVRLSAADRARFERNQTAG